jgi:hypothetical protein
MKKTILILLFSFSSLFATNWYVDKNATGSNNGTSWTNAWHAFAHISWASVNAGDIVYISGGTDSTVYTEGLSIGASGTVGNLITIRKGLDTGHNGKVVIQGSSWSGTGITTGGRDYLRIVGFTVRLWYQGMSTDGGSNVVYVDSCRINKCNWGFTFCTQGSGSDSIFLRRSTIISDSTTHTQTDAVGGTDATNIEVSNCYISQRNQFSGTGHSDMMQPRVTGNALYYNNWCETYSGINDPDSSAGAFNSQINLSGCTSLMYNNVFLSRGWSSGLYMDQGNTGHTWISYNNTFIKDFPYSPTGRHCSLFESDQVNTYAKNNIFMTTAAYGVLRGAGVMALVPSQANFDYNLYYFPNSHLVGDNNQWTTTAGWISDGADTHSPTPDQDPLFNDFRLTPNNDQFTYTPDLTLQAGSPAINAGTASIKAYIESFVWSEGTLPWTDYNGNPRDESTPSIGAFEYIDATDTTAYVAFTSVTNAELNSYNIASGVLTSVDSTFHIWTTTADSFKVGVLGTYGITMVEADSGDTVYVPNIASGYYSTPSISSIVVSGTPRSFTVITKSAPTLTSGILKSSDGKILRDSTGKIIKVSN